MLDEFAEAFESSRCCFLAQIYGSAQEVDHGDVKVEDLEANCQTLAIITAENVSPLLDHDNAVYVFMRELEIFKPMNTHLSVYYLV